MENFLLNSLIFILMIIIFIKLFYIDDNNLVMLKSKVDEDFHLVQELPDKTKAADMMAEIKNRIEKLINYLISTYPENEDIKRLTGKYNENNIRETSINDSGTSYSVDKGQEVYLCLRDKESLKLHQINILMFVTIHELAHIMSKTYGHNDEFNKNFIFLLKNSVKIGIYQNIDYSKNNKNFCGMTVDSNPLFN